MKSVFLSVLRCGTVLLTLLASLVPPARALVINPVTPTTLYVAISDQGLSKSTNGGATWATIDDGLRNFAILSLVIDPLSSGTFYSIGGRDGLLKSTDGGRHWALLLPGTVEVPVLSLAIDPRTPTTLYVGTNGGGILKSTDGGRNWTRILGEAPPPPQPEETTEPEGIAGYSLTPVTPRIPQPTIFTLVIDPQTPTTLYAGTDAGVKKSTDGGRHWVAMITGLHSMPGTASFYAPVQHLVLDPLTPTTLYASVDFSNGGLIKSTDGGASWAALKLGWPIGYGVDALAIDPKTPSTLYVAVNMAGLFKSTDGGQSWTAINQGLPLYVEPSDATNLYPIDLAVDPQTPTTLYVEMFTNGGNGVFKSTNGGRSWAFSNLGDSGLARSGE